MKIKKRMSICFGIFFVLFLMTIGNAAAVLEDGTETQITTDTSSQLNPDIYGDRIVWQDDSDGKSDIYMYDISIETETRITTSGSAVNPVIYGNTIVWSDGRNGNDGDIYTYDLSTKQETRITTSGKAHNPDIYGNKIVYQRSDWWSEDCGIFLYDLSTKNVTQLASDYYFSGGMDGDYYEYTENTNPVIYGNKIAWETYGGGMTETGYIISIYDLSNKVSSLENSSLSRYNYFVSPDIYNDRVIWCTLSSDSKFWVYDFSTMSETEIITSESVSSPHIYGDIIVWGNSTAYMDDNPNIYTYDLSTNTEIQITTSGSASNPAIYEDKIVWQDDRNGNSDIYMFTLASDEVPEPSVADFSANITSGYAPLSVQFTDLSKNATEWDWDFGDGATSIEQNPVHTYSAAGTYTVNLTVSNEYGTDSKNAAITVLAQPALPVFPGYTNPPTDLDQNGLYEDINGNGMLDFDDVVAYYDNMEWIEENAPVAFFDYNSNGLIDFDDVVKLYDML